MTASVERGSATSSQDKNDVTAPSSEILDENDLIVEEIDEPIFQPEEIVKEFQRNRQQMQRVGELEMKSEPKDKD